MDCPKPLFRIAAIALALAAAPAHAAQRAFVSSTGNDANAPSGCTPALPCRSFQAAHGAVDAGGEIVALDTAGFGALVISKSVALIGNPGAVPSIAVATGIGVNIATPGVKVVLRNLNINGVGGTKGIEMTAGESLTIENCVLSNFTHSGAYVWTDGAPVVRIANSTARGNGTGIYLAGNAQAEISGSHLSGNFGGLYATQNSGGVTQVAITDSVASGNSFGLVGQAFTGTVRVSLLRVTASNNANAGVINSAGVGGTALMTVGSSMATGNGIGFHNELAGGVAATFRSLGNNLVLDNGMDTFGTITATPGI